MAKRDGVRKFKESPSAIPIGVTTTARLVALSHSPEIAPMHRDTAWAMASVAVRFSTLLGAIMAGMMVFGVVDFALDDAYIHLAYAKSLRLGDGLSYNPGDFETGFSSPLWVALLAAWPVPTAAEADPVRTVALLGVLLHAATAMAGSALTLELLRIRARSNAPVPLVSLTALGGALVAMTPTLVVTSTSGMEVPLAAATVTACAWAQVADRARPAAWLAVAAVWARPEALGFVVALAGLLASAAWWKHRRLHRAALAGASAAAAALAVWAAYNLVVSGYPWPNTQAIKGGWDPGAGLAYLRGEVLPWQTWLVSLTGLILLGRACLRDLRSGRPEILALLLACTATVIGIVATRPLHPGTQFYESRYFALVAAIPPAVVPLGLLGLSRWLGFVLTLPLGLLSGLQAVELRALHREHAADTKAVHTDVALYLAQQLPNTAIVAVEGAGATRYMTPRSMTIVDLVGLNDRRAAHLHHDRAGKLCHFVELAPTHMVLPWSWTPLFSPVFELRQLTTFDDEHYTQVEPARPHRVAVYAVEGVAPEWVQRCARRPAR